MTHWYCRFLLLLFIEEIQVGSTLLYVFRPGGLICLVVRTDFHVVSVFENLNSY